MAQYKKTDSKHKKGHREYEGVIGGDLNFAAAEAYKLLRTNLGFGLPDKAGCKIIGVTSALRGEGKSTTAANIAYTMGQTDQRVLLLEADLRLPVQAKISGVDAAPGLSNLLAGQCNGKEVLQRSSALSGVRVVTAGDIPPNPAELLGSDQMEALIKAMSELFDIIVVDLPPVTAVSDALLVSRLVDGMVLVVRQHCCDRRSLVYTVQKLKFAEANILGFVMTDAETAQKRYKRYSYKYGQKYYGYGYGYGYRQKPKADK